MWYRGEHDLLLWVVWDTHTRRYIPVRLNGLYTLSREYLDTYQHSQRERKGPKEYVIRKNT